MDYEVIEDEGRITIIRAADGVSIPVDPQNRDYQSYLEWDATQQGA